MSDSIDLLIESVTSLLFKKRLTKVELAKGAGMSPQQLGDTLSGNRLPRISVLDRIAKALDVPTFYLLMSPEERAKWDQMATRAPTAKDRLKAIVAELTEKEAEELTPVIEVLRKPDPVPHSAQKKKSG